MTVVNSLGIGVKGDDCFACSSWALICVCLPYLPQWSDLIGVVLYLKGIYIWVVDWWNLSLSGSITESLRWCWMVVDWQWGFKIWPSGVDDYFRCLCSFAKFAWYLGSFMRYRKKLIFSPYVLMISLASRSAFNLVASLVSMIVVEITGLIWSPNDLAPFLLGWLV